MPLLLHDWCTGLGSKPDAEARLFCFAHAGGSAAQFNVLQEAAGPDIEVRVPRGDHVVG